MEHDMLSLVDSNETVRKINRGTNPYAAVIKNRNKSLSNSNNVYDPLVPRALAHYNENSIQKALQSLRERLQGQKYEQHHFGRLELIPAEKIDINVDIQRLIEILHVGENIIELFDPRIMQPVNVIYIKETGRYSAWEGQQSSTAFVLMRYAGLIADDVLVQCKVVDDDLMVPGSTLVGEATGNFGFRCVNGDGRKAPDIYYTYRSMLNGVRLYNSTLKDDLQVNEIQKVLENNNTFPSMDKKVRNQKQQPGEISYVSGLMNISNHGSEDDTFNHGLSALNWTLAWHDRYFAFEPGVDNGFMLAFSRFYDQAREQQFIITPELEQAFYQHMRTKYLTPSGFHNECKKRLKNWQIDNYLKTSWSDSCLLPIFILDFIKDHPNQALPNIQGLKFYTGV
jgi:hypothetical protein